MKKGILIITLLAVLITLYEAVDWYTHGDIVGYFIHKGSITQGRSDFTPKYLGLWTQGGIEIPKRPIGDVLEFAGQDPAPIVKQGLGLIYVTGDGSNVDELMLSRLTWSEAKEVFTKKEDISFHIAPSYKMKPNMYEIIFDPVLKKGYYVLHYRQGTAVYAYDFIIINDAQDTQYSEAVKSCDKFLKYLMAEKYSKLSDLLSNDLNRRIISQGEGKKFKSGFLENVLTVIKEKCEQTDPLFVNFPSYRDKRETLDYSYSVRLDRIRPVNVVRGRVVIPYEVKVNLDKQSSYKAEVDIEVIDGKINGYDIL